MLTGIIYKKMGLRCKKKNVEAMSLSENNKKLIHKFKNTYNYLFYNIEIKKH